MAQCARAEMIPGVAGLVSTTVGACPMRTLSTQSAGGRGRPVEFGEDSAGDNATTSQVCVKCQQQLLRRPQRQWCGECNALLPRSAFSKKEMADDKTMLNRRCKKHEVRTDAKAGAIAAGREAVVGRPRTALVFQCRACERALTRCKFDKTQWGHHRRNRAKPNCKQPTCKECEARV